MAENNASDSAIGRGQPRYTQHPIGGIDEHPLHGIITTAEEAVLIKETCQNLTYVHGNLDERTLQVVYETGLTGPSFCKRGKVVTTITDIEQFRALYETAEAQGIIGLPSVMIPERFIRLCELVRTPDGNKVIQDMVRVQRLAKEVAAGQSAADVVIAEIFC